MIPSRAAVLTSRAKSGRADLEGRRRGGHADEYHDLSATE
jgi:hypothetical protein